MTLRGRPRKPTALKLLQGNPGKRRIDPTEAQAPGGAPPKPAHIEGLAAEFWDRLTRIMDEMGYLSTADGELLELASAAYGHWREALAQVKRLGLVVQTGAKPLRNHMGDPVLGPDGKPILAGGSARANPFLKVADAQWDRLLRVLSSLGIPPTVRAKVTGARPKGKEKSEQEKLKQRFFGGA